MRNKTHGGKEKYLDGRKGKDREDETHGGKEKGILETVSYCIPALQQLITQRGIKLRNKILII